MPRLCARGRHAAGDETGPPGTLYADLYAIIAMLEGKGVAFKVLDDAVVDTTSRTGKQGAVHWSEDKIVGRSGPDVLGSLPKIAG